MWWWCSSSRDSSSSSKSAFDPSPSAPPPPTQTPPPTSKSAWENKREAHAINEPQKRGSRKIDPFPFVCVCRRRRGEKTRTLYISLGAGGRDSTMTLFKSCWVRKRVPTLANVSIWEEEVCGRLRG